MNDDDLKQLEEIRKFASELIVHPAAGLCERMLVLEVKPKLLWLCEKLRDEQDELEDLRRLRDGLSNPPEFETIIR